ncbi:4'-phosphopantetheinyl transferase superfamily [Aspergillus lucknowensis]|uniref:4'-phosphopantetheinyl transferase superfamily n=1 Tax=Aspergillus lucknowensis TaxID=176173 RepID=A0ABR4LU38_9EURO
MKPAPFPFALNIGIDIVHLPRIMRLISRPGGYLARFTRRILSEPEQQDFRTRFILPRFPPPNSPNSRSVDVKVTANMARWLAGRFAAKEAARKAARGGAKVVGWKDVVVRVGSDGEGDGAEGRPEVVFLNEGEGQGRVGRLSISHDGEYVVATVLAVG